jgi:Uma2 family endonuclease
MVQTRPKFHSFDDYLTYDDGTDHLYALCNGELIEVPPESGQTVQIANRLFLAFALMLERRYRNPVSTPELAKSLA